jgi:hypothetical protein
MTTTGETNRLTKLKQLTNNWGIYQHGKLDQPNPKYGYALEDQARALLVAEEIGEKRLAKIYFNFIIHSLGEEDKIYQFFYDKNGEIIPDKNIDCSEDGLGMVAWALLRTKSRHVKKNKILQIIFNKANDWNFVRSMAYLLLGLVMQKNGLLEDKITKKILEKYNEDCGWNWFENRLVYGNALLPWALWERGRIRKDKKALEVAEKSTIFLLEKCKENGIPLPVGCKGWFHKGEVISKYDQQPIEASYMVCCLEQAYLATGDKYYLKHAKNWWSWFEGNNINNIKLVDKKGGCFDAIIKNGVNSNQGAESNICYLMAYLAAKRMKLIEEGQ